MGSAAVRRGLVRGAMAGAAASLLAGAAVSAAATYLARRVVSPDAERPDDVHVLGVGAGTVTLRATPETVAPGRYGLWLERGGGHARLGEVIDHDDVAGTVTRRVLGIDSGRLREGPARWNQYFYAGTPTSALGLAYSDIDLDTGDGPLPTWFLPPSGGVPARDTWAILVHGRGATREECLRAIPVLHRLGFPALVVSYRNDAGAVRSRGGRYHLGDCEWLDVEAAVLHAVEHGARDVVLAGWSMGGAIVLQLMSRSWLSDRVRAVVLDSPVLDWRDVLDHHARVNRVPGGIGRLSQAMLGHSQAWRLAGVDAPVLLDRLDWVRRAEELQLPILLVHSDDDEFVPSGPSRRLAAARPDLVTYLDVPGARHTKEWNVDPDQWDTAVARFLLRL
ncbi:MAG TPA: alpha/beta fold hydrolase [Kineosporiaceae bacterium]|nr:alpha/beta fold hydrolase [Kineosporiaceae bacterium]